jgi:hypothetical protein
MIIIGRLQEYVLLKVQFYQIGKTADKQLIIAQATRPLKILAHSRLKTVEKAQIILRPMVNQIN